MYRRTSACFFLVGFALALVSTAFSQQAGSGPGRITLTRIVGTITVTNNDTGAEVPVGNGSVIAAGHTVQTALESQVILVFSNGSTLNLAADSSLNIQTFLQDPFSDPRPVAQWTAEPSVSTTRVFLARGELVGNVKTLNHDQDSSFTVETPAGAAGIRGTTFRIVYRPQGNGTAFFTLTTLEGNVEVGQITATGEFANSVQVADLEEVIIEVTVDENTGNVTNINTVTEGAATNASTDAINTIVAQIATETEAFVVPDTTDTGGGGTAGTGGGNDNQDDQPNQDDPQGTPTGDNFNNDDTSGGGSGTQNNENNQNPQGNPSNNNNSPLTPGQPNQVEDTSDVGGT